MSFSFLWIVGPMVAALVFLLTDGRDKRREAEIERWRRRMKPLGAGRKEPAGYRDGKESAPKEGAGPRAVNAMPGPFARMIVTAGGGKKVAYYELVPKLAYLALMGGDVMAGSDQQTVVAKLEEAGPMFTVRPLAILDGQSEPNTGVQFKKDEEFMAAFVVERALEGGDAAPAPATEAVDKAIRKWLSPTVRAALLDLPDAWLRVSGTTMAITLYGPADADALHDLATAADVIFAEYGAEGGPSLFGDDEEDEAEAAPAPPPKKKAGAKKGGAGKTA